MATPTTDSASCNLEFGSILDGFCATELPIVVAKARSVVVDQGNIYVLERGTESILRLIENDGIAKEVVATERGLNHGLAVHNEYIYASSDTTVFRWSLSENESTREIVVTNMNKDGMGGAPQGHTTRTIVFDDTNVMYISVGSNKNVDPDSHRSRIRRVDLSSSRQATLPVDFQSMEVFADGLRNEVGMAFDRHGILWGVENSADNLYREDLGGDIHQDNPAEELNKMDPALDAKHYGYPYCWTEYELPSFGNGRGTQWAWPSFHVDYGGSLTDQDCETQYEAPALALQGHSAPLGITFFEYDQATTSSNCSGSFPQSMDGYAFIAYHGSWNRDVPTGYKIVYVEMDAEGNPVGEPVDLLAHAPPNAQWEDGFRPVDVAFDACGRLLVTSDGTRGVGSKIVRIDYQRETENASSAAAAYQEPLWSLLCLVIVSLLVTLR